MVQAVLSTLDRRPNERFKVEKMIGEVFGKAAIDKPYDQRDPADSELQATMVRRAMARAVQLRPWMRFEYGEMFDGTRPDLYSSWYEPNEITTQVARARALKGTASKETAEQSPKTDSMEGQTKVRIRQVEPPRRIQAKFQALKTLLAIEATDGELNELVNKVKAERRKRA